MKFTLAIAALLSITSAVKVNDYFQPWEHVADGKAEGKYERVIPKHFSADSDDLFMRSMLKKYALEEKTKVKELDDGTKVGGEPTGKFWLDKEKTKAAASEVLGTHKGLSGGALSSYLDTYFEKAWGHFDVNLTGTIEVIKMPQFMRFICSDQYMQLGESG